MAVVQRVTGAEARRLDDVLLPFQRAAKYVADNYGQLVEQYPEQWVAVAEDRVLVADPDREVVRRVLREQQRERNRVYVTFLTAKRQPLIL